MKFSPGFFFSLFFLSLPVYGAAGAWQVNTHGKVRLVSSLDKVAAASELWLGLEFQPIPGWHVYWKNAGDYGYPPTVSWEGSAGFKQPELLWPAPHRYSLPGDIDAFGYESEVVYPVRVTYTHGSVHGVAQVSYLTCSDACVPYKVTLTLDIPEASNPVTDAEGSRLIEAYRRQVAVPPAAHPELSLQPQLLQNAHGTYFELLIHSPETLSPEEADVFFDKDDQFTFGAPVKDHTRQGDLRFRLAVSTLSGSPVPDSLKVSYTVTQASYQGNRLALEDHRRLSLKKIMDSSWAPQSTAEKTAAASRSAPANSQSKSLPWLIVLGFLGGLILNAMPCVLPVLSIKLLGVLKSGGHSQGAVVRNALASASGIIASFLGLALAVIVLRQTGHAIGWGIQFQQPLFVGLLALVVFGFALNLWGVFEIGMPRIFGHFSTTFGRGESTASYFISGVFATLLATPCSAPFLGTAMGFALAQSAGTVLVIFLAAGSGMAVPYFALAAFPRSVRWLPKPGAWMLRVKAVLGLLLAATGLWLLTVLWAQVRPGHAQPAAAVQHVGGLSWVAFNEEEIQRELALGRTVFVDVTADWCFTCQFNEKFVLQSSDVVQAFKARQVIMMRADWTNHNSVIADYLKKFNRAGIPFNVLYKPGQAPVPLSEFLTKKQVLDALEK